MKTMKRKRTMKTTGPLKRSLFNDFGRASLMLVLSGLLLASCTGGGLEPSPEEGGSAVQFTVSAVQEPDTRALRTAADDPEASPGGPDAYLSGSESPDTSRIIACTSEGDFGEVYLIESEEEYGDCGAEAHTLTRAEMTTAITEKFSTIGYRATSASGVNGATPWFHNAETNPDGTLVTPVYWWDMYPYARFYGIYPYTANVAGDNIRLSPPSHNGTPYVDFKAEPNVTGQQDLLTACSGPVHYATSGVHPRTDLKFRHALTAVKFAVGADLPPGKTIDRVEIRNAISKGRYTMATDETGTDATWAPDESSRTDFSLTCHVSTNASPNDIIIGRPGDNSVFYMVPQTLTGNNVRAVIHFADGAVINAILLGSWLPGTVKTYKISLTWILRCWGTGIVVDFDQTNAGSYSIASYHQPPGGTMQPIPWQVVSYREESGDQGWGPENDTPPTWLTLSKTSGPGIGYGQSSEIGTAWVTSGIVDNLSTYNNALKNAPAKGSASNYYDLSTHDADGNGTSRSTANCYVISAPGHYKIPLVYGNAITNGATNSHAYISQALVYPSTETYILRNFKDHVGQDITDPWITQTNGGANVPDGAKLVWADEIGLVAGLDVEGSGEDAYVHFEVPADKIRNANAVIAVTKGDTVVWSWHLWFAPADVLGTVACTNYQGDVFHFTNEPLGWKYAVWEVSTYSEIRRVAVKIEQTVANNGVKQTGYILVQQSPGSKRNSYATFYQFGRKDAMPGAYSNLPEGSFIESSVDNMSIQNGIQHPETCYQSPYQGHNNSWFIDPPIGYTYSNVWSMDSFTDDETSNTVKTIYDPCPAGFKVPPANAFTGFTLDGQNYGPKNVSGVWDDGWHFNNKIASPDTTIYFPDVPYLDYGFHIHGKYWAAVVLRNHTSASALYFAPAFVLPKSGGHRFYGYAVRPVRDVDFGGGHSGGESGGGLGD